MSTFGGGYTSYQLVRHTRVRIFLGEYKVRDGLVVLMSKVNFCYNLRPTFLGMDH